MELLRDVLPLLPLLREVEPELRTVPPVLLLRVVDPELRTVLPPLLRTVLPELREVDPELRTVPPVLLLREVEPELRTVLPVLPLLRDVLPEVRELMVELPPELPSRRRMDPPVRVPTLLLAPRPPDAGATLLPDTRDPLLPVRAMPRVLSIVPAPPLWAPLPPPIEIMRGRDVPPRDSGLGS